jgi:hypothetical protein
MTGTKKRHKEKAQRKGTEKILASYKTLSHKNGRYVVKRRRKYETAFGFKTEPNLKR